MHVIAEPGYGCSFILGACKVFFFVCFLVHLLLLLFQGMPILMDVLHWYSRRFVILFGWDTLPEVFQKTEPPHDVLKNPWQNDRTYSGALEW